MQKKLFTVILLSLLLSSAAALADGDIYNGSPAGTRISSLPYTISTPGAYYLASNLSYGNGDGITIANDHVTLDLMGFAITASNGHGINIAGPRKNVEIRNGTVISNGNDWGNWTIFAEESGNATHRIINVRIVSGSVGIYLNGYGHLIQGCEVNAYETGIETINATISGCTIRAATGGGISVNNGLVRGNVVIGYSNGGWGIGCNTNGIMGSVVIGNDVTGFNHGIHCGTGVSIIGNIVNTSGGGKNFGIMITDDKTNVLDQNTVCGDGTHYNGGGDHASYMNVQYRNNR